MAKGLRWSTRAKRELYDILEFWKINNQSPSYSIKLLKRINESLSLIRENNYLGKRTSDATVRITIVEHFLIYYEVLDTEILVITIFDARRNPFSTSVK